MPRKMPGDCALSSACRSVNSHDDLAARVNGTKEALLRAHPRFFELCLDAAVKPNRFAFPALAPAARAGLRLLREDRASTRASFLGALLLRRRLPPRAVVPALPAVLLPLPRCPTAGTEGLLLRAVEETLAE